MMDNKSCSDDTLNEKIKICKYEYELVNKWIDSADNRVNICVVIFTGVIAMLNLLINKDYSFSGIKATHIYIRKAITSSKH